MKKIFGMSIVAVILVASVLWAGLPSKNMYQEALARLKLENELARRQIATSRIVEPGSGEEEVSKKGNITGRRASTQLQMKYDVFGRPYVMPVSEGRTRRERAEDKTLSTIRNYRLKIKLLEDRIKRIKILCDMYEIDISVTENEKVWDKYIASLPVVDSNSMQE